MINTLLKDVALSETGLVFNPVTGESFSANPIGIGILNSLREGKSNVQICEQLVAEFNVDAATAERDILDFMNLLKHYQLTTPDVRK
jgi:hypothetical protein